MLLNDRQITERALNEGMISPFKAYQVRSRGIHKTISHGLSSYGYDITLATEFKIFTNANCAIVDPKNFDQASFVDRVLTPEEDHILVPPNSFALARSMETIKVPRDVLVICIGKSSYARCGIILNVTPLEPEWEGQITLEISNTTPLPAKVYAREGIAQLIFLKADEECDTSYSDRGGKYNKQEGVTLPRM